MRASAIRSMSVCSDRRARCAPAWQAPDSGHSWRITVNKILVLAVAALIVAQPASANDAQSMFDELSYRALVGDTKAHEIGDVLTVIVQEAASASSSADLRT